MPKRDKAIVVPVEQQPTEGHTRLEPFEDLMPSFEVPVIVTQEPVAEESKGVEPLVVVPLVDGPVTCGVVEECALPATQDTVTNIEDVDEETKDNKNVDAKPIYIIESKPTIRSFFDRFLGGRKFF